MLYARDLSYLTNKIQIKCMFIQIFFSDVIFKWKWKLKQYISVPLLLSTNEGIWHVVRSPRDPADSIKEIEIIPVPDNCKQQNLFGFLQ